jgi:adhesin/invasin
MLRQPPVLVGIVLLALATSCGSDAATTTSDNTPTAITISPPGAATIPSGTTATLTAAVTTRDGRPVTGAAVVWSSSNSTVATVTDGVVTAIKVGTTTITAASGALNAALPVTVVPGAATQLALRAQPADGAIGSPLTPTPVVEIRDAAGNVATTATAAVTVTIANGGGSLSGTLTAPAVAGVVTFTGVTVLGTAGPRILRFSSLGLASVSSAEFTMATPTGRFIVIDSTSVSSSAQQGSNPAARTVQISSGGNVALAGVTVDPVAYDAGQLTGWLGTTLTASGGAQFALTLSFAATSLPIGTYHATVRVNATGATNTPQAISVTLSVLAAVNITYGSSTEKIRVLDVGGAYTPTITPLINGAVQPVSAVTFRSRAATVATVDATGRVSAVGPGDTWIVASLQSASDSVFVNVTRNTTGPLLRANLTTYSVRSGETVSPVVTLDPRATPLGSATVLIGYEAQNGMFFPLAADIPAETPQPVGSNPSVGLYRVSFASAIPVTIPVTMLQLKLIAQSSGLTGYITLTVTSITGPSGADLSAQTTTTRYPIIIR